MNHKTCFVIAPLGEDGSSARRRSGQILAHLIRPVASNFGYDVTRADEIAEQGIITTHVVQHLVNDALVIADLTGRNPNVYYELAVRHATRKPIIQLIESGEPLPFDVAATRTIVIDHKDLDSVEEAKKQLARYIANAEAAAPGTIDSPISLALDIDILRQSSDPQRAGLADIVERMASVQGSILGIERAIDVKLSHRLEQVHKLALTLKEHLSKNEHPDAVSNLNESIDDLRARLNRAVSRILDDIQNQHTQLALKIQSVFEEQSITAADMVERSFAEILARGIADTAERERLLTSLVEVFMHGMRSMGTYQRINVTDQTQTSTKLIRERINKSIEEVFLGIDKIQEQLTALPPISGV